MTEYVLCFVDEPCETDHYTHCRYGYLARTQFFFASVNLMFSEEKKMLLQPKYSYAKKMCISINVSWLKKNTNYIFLCS